MRLYTTVMTIVLILCSFNPLWLKDEFSKLPQKLELFDNQILITDLSPEDTSILRVILLGKLYTYSYTLSSGFTLAYHKYLMGKVKDQRRWTDLA